MSPQKQLESHLSRCAELFKTHRTAGGLLGILETFRDLSRLVSGGEEEEEEEEALGMLSTFTGVGGALPERGRERPGRKKDLLPVSAEKNPPFKIREVQRTGGTYHREGGGLGRGFWSQQHLEEMETNAVHDAAGAGFDVTSCSAVQLSAY